MRPLTLPLEAATGTETSLDSMSETASPPSSIAVLTSGGDAGGMNAAVRAVVRTALFHGIDAFVIHDGFQGLVDGGEAIRRVESADVGRILHRGGTVFGTARCKEFRTQVGRRKAVRNLLERRIDGLVVIGGDASLTGADLFRQEWAGVVAELVEAGAVTSEVAASHPFLRLVGLAGSIDNDMSGTDMTIPRQPAGLFIFGQENPEDGPLTGPRAGRRELSAVGLDEGLGDGQADTGPSVGPIPSGVDPVEAFEHVGQVLGGDALTGVCDGQHHPTACGRRGSRDRDRSAGGSMP